MSQAIQLEASLARDAFRFNEAELTKLLTGSEGPVMRDLSRRAIRVESSAKRYATGQGGGPNVRTGRLRGSITWRLGRDARGPYADVGTNVFYGPFVEMGTSRMSARPYLRPALESARA